MSSLVRGALARATVYESLRAHSALRPAMVLSSTCRTTRVRVRVRVRVRLRLRLRRRLRPRPRPRPRPRTAHLRRLLEAQRPRAACCPLIITPASAQRQLEGLGLGLGLGLG